MNTRDMIGVALVLVLMFTLLMNDDKHQRVVKYDCSISEISPDYPVEVKEACRRMRAERSKQ